MDEGESALVSRALEGLLAIAKVAMPSHLYALDPRVAAASELLEQITSPVDAGPKPAWDITEGIDRFMATRGAEQSQRCCDVDGSRVVDVEWVSRFAAGRA